MNIIPKLTLLIAVLAIFPSLAAETDSAMRSVSYTLNPNQVSIAGFKPGQAAFLNVRLCNDCNQQKLPLAVNAQLYKDQQALSAQTFIDQFYKKDFTLIRLGVNRDQQAISYINLASNYGEEPESDPASEGE